MIVAAILTAALLVPLPGTGVSVAEKTGDPVRLSAYGLGGKQVYLRGPKGFTRKQGLTEVAVSPDLTRAAGVPASYQGGFDGMVLIDRATGRSTRVATVKKPLTASYASWSRDGSKVALTVEQKVSGKWRSIGYTVVDVATRKARTVRVKGLDAKASLWWSPDGTLVARYKTGVRFYRASDGRTIKTYLSAGLPTGPEDGFSPSGKRLTTWCPARFAEHVCLVDPATGTIARRVAVRPSALFGWWDESHLIAVLPKGGAYQLAVVDLSGKVSRVLGAVPAKTWRAGWWVSFSRQK